MTSLKQVKKLVQPLLDCHDDLALVGRWIFVRPVQHFARGIIIDRTSDPRKFMPRWAVAHVFEVRNSIPLSWGGYVYSHDSNIVANFWDQEDQEISRSLVSEIERNALPILRTMETLDDYLAFVSASNLRGQLFSWHRRKVIVDVALGELAAAREICRQEIEYWKTGHSAMDEDDRAEFRRLVELCARLAADDRPGLAQLLHKWERTTVKNLKIEHLWEPTPFPLEQR
jgi:hypothetical protein